MTETDKTLFWIAIFLIAEPALAALWPRARAALFLSFPLNEAKICQVQRYYDRLNLPLHIMSPLRKRIRRWMQSIGVIILIVLLALQMM